MHAFASDTSSIQQVADDLVEPGAVYPARGSVLFLTICLKLWAVSLVKHHRRLSSQRKPQIHKPVPREALHITAARDQFGGHGASVIRAWSRIPGRASDVPGGQRGFKGGPLTLTLHPPDFRSLRGHSVAVGPVFFGRDTACGSTGYGNRGTWPKLPYRPETLCSSPTCSTLTLTRTFTAPFCGPANSNPNGEAPWGRVRWTWSRCVPHDSMLP